MFDESEPTAKKPRLRPLDDMSIGGLEEYIGELQAEIERVRNTIKIKQTHAEVAAGFFKNE